MGFSKSPFFSISIVLLTVSAFLIIPISASDIYDFVYKDCAKQTFTNSNGFQDTLTSLFNSFSTQSSTTHFYKTSSGAGQTAVSGLYQCRSDLAFADCNTCVSRVPQMATSLCGDAVAAQIQLAGCSIQYSLAGYPQVSGTQMQYKVCGSSEATFQEKRDKAFSQLEAGFAGGSDFYATTFESVYVMGQCEGDLSGGDCGECVKEALQQAEEVCGRAVSGQIYLFRCYISYKYYPNGVSGDESSGSGQDTGKTVAIVIGGAFALFFVVSSLLFIRSLLKKRDGY
ncbi:hypothetical protein AAC387_Pa05g0353 [Persea americana]